MKKTFKGIAAFAVVLAFFSFCATSQEAEQVPAAEARAEEPAPAPAETEKPAKAKKAKKEKKAKEKKQKPPKEKKAKKEKPKKEKPVKEPKKTKFNQSAYDAAFEKGDYATCVGMLYGRGDKKDYVRDLIDADMLIYLSENYQGAGKAFLDTYAKMQLMNSDMSAGEATKAALSSETSTKYSGAEYERYLVWSMRLASALNTNQTDVANGIMKDYVGTFMAEIQELRRKNAEMEAESEKQLEGDEFRNAQDKLASEGVSMTFSEKPAKSGVKYENSPFFNYLGTIAYAASGDFDHAEEFGAVYKVPQAKDITQIPSGMGRVEIVALSGMIGRRADAGEGKAAQAVYLPIPDLNMHIPLYTKVAYPVFDPAAQKHLIKSVRVSLSDGSSARAELIEDFDTAVEIDVAQKAPGAYSRSVFRNVVKNSIVSASVVAAGIALKQASSASAIAGIVAQVAFNASVDAAANAVANKEHADTRQAYYFPNKASAAGFNVAPGTYSATVEYLDGAGNLVGTKTIENIAVKAGEITARVSSCEK